MLPDTNTPMPSDPRPSYATLVADALMLQPELLRRAQATCQRWRQLEAQPVVWLDRWDGVLTEALASEAGMTQLQHILRSDDADSERLREFAPLAGLLPREVRRTARGQCGFRH